MTVRKKKKKKKKKGGVTTSRVYIAEIPFSCRQCFVGNPILLLDKSDNYVPLTWGRGGIFLCVVILVLDSSMSEI